MTSHAEPILAPRTPRNRNSSRGNFELYSWLFMRLSGLALVVLVLGHLFVNLMLGEGIKAIDFAFVAGKWANPFWQVWDLLMLWLAQLHGTNGLRTLINDYAAKDQTRIWLKVLLYSASIVIVLIRTFAILLFEAWNVPSFTLDVCK